MLECGRNVPEPGIFNPSNSSGVTVEFDTLKPMLMRQFFVTGKKPSSNMGGELANVIADHIREGHAHEAD